MEKKNEGMTLIVKTTARLTAWFILLYGFYLVIHGHLASGGGFAGGLMIALAMIHLLLAYGRDYIRRRINPEWIQKLMASGVAAFLLVGWLGLLITGKLFLNFLAKGHFLRDPIRWHNSRNQCLYRIKCRPLAVYWFLLSGRVPDSREVIPWSYIFCVLAYF